MRADDRQCCFQRLLHAHVKESSIILLKCDLGSLFSPVVGDTCRRRWAAAPWRHRGSSHTFRLVKKAANLSHTRICRSLSTPMIETLSYPAAVAAMLASLVASGAALHSCARLPAGHPLLVAVAAACTALNFAAPLLLFDANTCHSTRGMTTFAISWIASSKALALACGRGQLAARRWTAPHFLALYIMPLLADTEAPSSADAPKVKRPGAAAAGAAAAAATEGGSEGSAGGSLARRTAVNAAITALCLLGAVLGPPLLVKQALLSLAMYGWLGECTQWMPAVVEQMPAADWSRSAGG